MFRKLGRIIQSAFWSVVNAVTKGAELMSFSAAGPYLAYCVYTKQRRGKGLGVVSDLYQKAWKKDFLFSLLMSLPYYGLLVSCFVFSWWWCAAGLILVPVVFIAAVRHSNR